MFINISQTDSNGGTYLLKHLLIIGEFGKKATELEPGVSEAESGEESKIRVALVFPLIFEAKAIPAT